MHWWNQQIIPVVGGIKIALISKISAAFISLIVWHWIIWLFLARIVTSFILKWNRLMSKLDEPDPVECADDGVEDLASRTADQSPPAGLPDFPGPNGGQDQQQPSSPPAPDTGLPPGTSAGAFYDFTMGGTATQGGPMSTTSRPIAPPPPGFFPLQGASPSPGVTSPAAPSPTQEPISGTMIREVQQLKALIRKGALNKQANDRLWSQRFWMEANIGHTDDSIGNELLTIFQAHEHDHGVPLHSEEPDLTAMMGAINRLCLSVLFGPTGDSSGTLRSRQGC